MTAVFDRRRIAAPESSYAPSYVSSAENEPGPSRKRERQNNQSRPIFLKTGLISQANGSGYIEAGGVKIACSVYGPRPRQPPYSPQGTLNLEIKFAPFASHPRRAPLRDTEPIPLSTLLAAHLLPALQLHLLPKSAVDVHLLILESDILPNVLSAGLTVASAAIADAGIPMSALAVGQTTSIVDDNRLVDPETEEEEGQAVIALGVMPAVGKISGIWLSGEMDVDQASDIIETSVGGTKATHTTLAKALLAGAKERGLS